MTALALKCETPSTSMTGPVPVQQQSPPKADTAAATARKRRRRAPAGGAADDCFTCSKRNVKCDRRRPYCSQCLEVGNECSGYKTQLTWGVGVASRGKLRGLSLPIAKSPPVTSVGGKKGSPTRSRAGSAHTPSIWTEQQQQQQQQQQLQQQQQTQQDDSGATPRHRPHQLDIASPTQQLQHQHQQPPTPSDHATSTPTTPFHGSYDMASRVSHAEPMPSSQAPQWNHMPFSTSLPTEALRFAKMAGPMGGEGLSSSIDSLSDVEYLSPISHSFPREDIPFMHSPTIMYESFTNHNSPSPQSPLAAMIMEQRSAPTSCPSLVYAPSEQGSSMSSHPDNFASQLSSKLMLDCDSMVGTPDMDTYSTSAQSTSHFWGPPATTEEEVAACQAHSDHAAARSLAAWPSAMEAQPQTVHVSPDLIAKMPFFMDYYENTMCPSMVFIDGPHNPFRDHILQLAAGSRSLQHAICALAACNLRMKRRLSLGRHSPGPREQHQHQGSVGIAAEAAAALSELPVADDSSLQEEYQHRNLAVHLLNEQLNDPTKSKHDSVLATILLLCHYRMAESGIAKFHTQFAGVKKILSMRRTSPFPPSRDSAWMEALFTYFDAISASINDREAQLNTSFYGVHSDALLLPPGSENLVGCDRELFRTIIKLGRLNLLSQHRPVQNLASPSPLPRGIPSRSQSPLGSPLGHVYKPNGTGASSHNPHLSHMDMFGNPAAAAASRPQNHHHRFDGNGFATTLDDEEIMSAALGSSPAYDDHRSTFWREWKEARNALQTWVFDPQRLAASLPPGGGPAATTTTTTTAQPPTASQVRDLGSLSEAFRYAALLYTERLASPGTPSSHSSFRNLVSQVVYYATSLEAGSSAEKFLLWPLFVAGSECVNELQQNLVRSKCRDIMARSGYMNNLAALDVLERLWASGGGSGGVGGEARGDDGGKGMLRPSCPFNWAKCIGGPGVEVEWIMF